MNTSACHQGRIYIADTQEKCGDTNSSGRQWKMEEAVCWQSMSTYFRTPQYWI